MFPQTAIDAIEQARIDITEMWMRLDPIYPVRDRNRRRGSRYASKELLYDNAFVLIATDPRGVSKEYYRWSQLAQIVEIQSPWRIKVKVLATELFEWRHSNQLRLFDGGSCDDLPLSVLEIARVQQATKHRIHSLMDIRFTSHKVRRLEVLVEFIPTTVFEDSVKKWKAFSKIYKRVPHLVLELLSSMDMDSELNRAILEKLRPTDRRIISEEGGAVGLL